MYGYMRYSHVWVYACIAMYGYMRICVYSHVCDMRV